MISQFMHSLRCSPSCSLPILDYLKDNFGNEILFDKNIGLVLEAYINPDYANSPVDGQSIIGYCSFLGGNLLT